MLGLRDHPLHSRSRFERNLGRVAKIPQLGFHWLREQLGRTVTAGPDRAIISGLVFDPTGDASDRNENRLLLIYRLAFFSSKLSRLGAADEHGSRRHGVLDPQQLNPKP